jgi:hypothetical protein
MPAMVIAADQNFTHDKGVTDTPPLFRPGTPSGNVPYTVPRTPVPSQPVAQASAFRLVAALVMALAWSSSDARARSGRMRLT